MLRIKDKAKQKPPRPFLSPWASHDTGWGVLVDALCAQAVILMHMPVQIDCFRGACDYRTRPAAQETPLSYCQTREILLLSSQLLLLTESEEMVCNKGHNKQSIWTSSVDLYQVVSIKINICFSMVVRECWRKGGMVNMMTWYQFCIIPRS